MTLAEAVRNVQTRDDFVRFLTKLQADLRDNRDQWANADLASFLEAMAAWVQDSEGFYQNTGQRAADLPPWRLFADILMASRMYE